MRVLWLISLMALAGLGMTVAQATGFTALAAPFDALPPVLLAPFAAWRLALLGRGALRLMLG